MGVEAGLKDTFHRPKEPVISNADKASSTTIIIPLRRQLK
jgi:hypothetical protein